jgi:hypothetical protein
MGACAATAAISTGSAVGARFPSFTGGVAPPSFGVPATTTAGRHDEPRLQRFQRERTSDSPYIGSAAAATAAEFRFATTNEIDVQRLPGHDSQPSRDLCAGTSFAAKDAFAALAADRSHLDTGDAHGHDEFLLGAAAGREGRRLRLRTRSAEAGDACDEHQCDAYHTGTICGAHGGSFLEQHAGRRRRQAPGRRETLAAAARSRAVSKADQGLSPRQARVASNGAAV